MRARYLKVNVVLLSLAACVLLACGGGGGGGGGNGGGGDGGPGPTPVLHAISGSITGATGVTVTLSGGGTTRTATADGTFTFSDLADGDYTVSCAKDGYTFRPSSSPVTLSGADRSVTFAAFPAPKFAYVTTGGDQILRYRVEPSGALTALEPLDVPDMSPADLDSDVSNTHLYVANSRDDSISQYAIASDGSLSPLSPAKISVGGSPSHVHLHPTLPFAYAIAPLDRLLTTFAIGANGALSPVTGGTLTFTTTPFDLAITPDGKSAYVTLYDRVLQFGIGPDGTPVALDPSLVSMSSGAKHITVDPSGDHLFVLFGSNTPTHAGVRPFAVEAGGTLSALTESATVEDFPFSIAISPSGKNAYVAGNDGIYRYPIAEDGNLGAPSPEDMPFEFPLVFFDPAGAYLYVVDDVEEGNIWQFSVADDGSLSPLAVPSVSAGAYPRSMVFVSPP